MGNYRASEKADDDDKLRGISNPDAESFADAYYQALDNAKHGNKIVLPILLHETLPKRFRKYLCPKERGDK